VPGPATSVHDKCRGDRASRCPLGVTRASDVAVWGDGPGRQGRPWAPGAPRRVSLRASACRCAGTRRAARALAVSLRGGLGGSKPEARSAKREARSPMLEARSPMLEARSPKPEARSPKRDARSAMPEARCAMRDARRRLRDVRRSPSASVPTASAGRGARRLWSRLWTYPVIDSDFTVTAPARHRVRPKPPRLRRSPPWFDRQCDQNHPDCDAVPPGLTAKATKTTPTATQSPLV